MDHQQEKIANGGPEYPQGGAPQQQYHAHPPMGQPAMHPSAYGQQGGEWQADLCTCSPCTSCMLAWCLPCLLVGQTSERIRDPSMQSADMMNSDCMIYTAIACCTGCAWIYGMMKRSEIRERYQIEGSGCNDCCVSYWCPCCALIQQDNEVKIRQQNAQPIAQGYQPQPGMQMPPPTYQQPQH
ncbi:PLAC8-domain-containing protein [Hypoxylon sp. FL1284]|nr:PLAC8-domain-containing protein [Hypoxylon sp. FL1284]